MVVVVVVKLRWVLLLLAASYWAWAAIVGHYWDSRASFIRLCVMWTYCYNIVPTSKLSSLPQHALHSDANKKACWVGFCTGRNQAWTIQARPDLLVACGINMFLAQLPANSLMHTRSFMS